MLLTSALIAIAANTRTESRGTHSRADHRDRDDASWCRHVQLERAPDGAVGTRIGPAGEPSDAPFMAR